MLVGETDSALCLQWLHLLLDSSALAVSDIKVRSLGIFLSNAAPNIMQTIFLPRPDDCISGRGT